MARCAGPAGRLILLSGAEPAELSPGWSHSRPTRESQPSGLRRSALCCSRQTAFSFCQEVSCERAIAGNNAIRKAIKVRQAERFLKRMTEYTLEEKRPGMRASRKEQVRASLPQN